jgi:transcriptional regulator with XRE-family HTH domain
MERRKFSEGALAADARWGKLSLRISEVVNTMLQERGVSQAALCKKIDYAQSVISKTLCGKQRWSFTLLLLVADALDVQMSTIIAAAEDESALFALRYAGTQPRSEERLNAIVRSIAPPGTSKEVIDMLFSAAMLRIVVPQLRESYLNGDIADEKLYNFLKETADSVVDDENLWGKVQLRLTEMGGQLE